MSSQALTFFAQFTASKAGKTGIAPTFNYKLLTRSTGSLGSAVAGTTVTEVDATNQKGLYKATLTGIDTRTYDVIGTFHTADATVDQQDLPALWSEFSPSALVALPDATAGLVNGLPELIGDNAGGLYIPSLLDSTSYYIWDDLTTSFVSAGTNTITLSGMSSRPTVGSTIVIKDTSSEFMCRTITNVSEGSHITITVDTPWQITGDDFGYIPDATCKALYLTAPGTAILSRASATAVAAIPAGVLDVAASAHNTAGTIGEKINSAGSSADPLLNAVPGTYAAGTAGYALGNNQYTSADRDAATAGPKQ